MGAFRLCAASLLRRRIVGMLAIAALIGMAGAVTIAAFAGARRTDTAYPRLLEQSGAIDVAVSPDFGETVSARALKKIPSGESAFAALGFAISFSPGGGGPFDDDAVSVGG